MGTTEYRSTKLLDRDVIGSSSEQHQSVTIISDGPHLYLSPRNSAARASCANRRGIGGLTIGSSQSASGSARGSKGYSRDADVQGRCAGGTTVTYAE